MIVPASLPPSITADAGGITPAVSAEPDRPSHRRIGSTPLAIRTRPDGRHTVLAQQLRKLAPEVLAGVIVDGHRVEFGVTGEPPDPADVPPGQVE